MGWKRVHLFKKFIKTTVTGKGDIVRLWRGRVRELPGFYISEVQLKWFFIITGRRILGGFHVMNLGGVYQWLGGNFRERKTGIGTVGGFYPLETGGTRIQSKVYILVLQQAT